MKKEWQEKMIEGMRLIKEACQANDSWNKCHNCPFDQYCSALMEAEIIDQYQGIDWDL